MATKVSPIRAIKAVPAVSIHDVVLRDMQKRADRVLPPRHAGTFMRGFITDYEADPCQETIDAARDELRFMAKNERERARAALVGAKTTHRPLPRETVSPAKAERSLVMDLSTVEMIAVLTARLRKSAGGNPFINRKLAINLIAALWDY